MARKVTERQAEAARQAILAQWGMSADAPYGPTIKMDFDYFGGSPAVSLLWEEGPFEWAILAGGGFTEFGHDMAPAAMPSGVRGEATTSFILALYRD